LAVIKYFTNFTAKLAILALIGRKQELEQLLNIQKAGRSAFVAVYGRRRVGKTYLIRTAFDHQFDFYLTGLANATTAQQLGNFHLAMQKYAPLAAGEKIADNWMNAFQQLIAVLEKSKQQRKIIFLDELPWLDTAQSGFISALEHFWNSWASARADILLIVCGSAAAWMISTLINNTGGLHNRVTHRLRIQPFSLHECELFFRAKKAVYDRYQLMLLYMVMGGIPFYLEQVETTQSAAQNINRLCFEPDGLLRNEFDNLYRSLFNKPEKHIAVIEALGKKNKGLTRKELIELTQISDGGGLSRILNELEESNFIRRYAPYGGKDKNGLYQLTDCYSLFYLKWIRGSSDLDANTWINQLDSPAQRAWSGYAFEQACLAHIPQIKKALGIAGVQTVTSSWISRNDQQGAQVDLVIDRRDQVINICEMKFSINDFTIDKKYAAELRNKLTVFKQETKTRKALFLTMITSFGLSQNSYASLVQNELTMDVLFEP
jgi:uncharacterized protein